MNLLDKLGHELLFFDGGMGTMLQDAGLPPGELPEEWNLSRPEVIRDIHLQYLQAGCHIVKANTFGANGLKFDNAAQIVAAGVRTAKEAVTESGRDALAALDIGPTGKLLKPMGDLDFEDALRLFREMVEAGTQAGADLILIETMSDTLEAKAAVLAAKEASCLPVIVTMIFDESGRLLTGADIRCACTLLEGLGVDALGFNCALGPDQMIELEPQLAAATSLPIVINPNAGLPVSVNGKTQYNVGPAQFASKMAELVRGGACVIGGCCGTTPAHIKAMAEVCRDFPLQRNLPEPSCVVSSYSRTVTFGSAPVIIGERINPTGKARFKQALRDNDLEYILKEGLSQQDAGAHILDVNVGLPEIDETDMMTRAVEALQGITALPLQIDTSDPEAMEAALRRYNGKALVNSVNGKQESMEAVFPLLKKYGGVAVALTLDESGIPENAQGRISIAEKILETAEHYGLKKTDFLFDPLAMTISTGGDNARIVLDCLDILRNRMGVQTVLGVSNISFGLPQRGVINAAFYGLAMERGLSAGIINPLSKPMMDTYASYCALSGHDSNCAAYIARYSQAEDAPVPAAQQSARSEDLHTCIVTGLKEEAGRCAAKALKEKLPLDIVNGELIPALDEVGQGFEQGTLFLPQLLMSAEAAKCAFDEIKAHLARTQQQEKGEKIILATVHGDIHDIGKNIVKVLLENYGYDVIDLGKDVPEEDIVTAAIEQDVKLVGLSALMTTTVPAMEQTIRLLRRQKPDCKIMVGGAVLNQEYADQIGADFYGKDATASVQYANSLWKEID